MKKVQAEISVHSEEWFERWEARLNDPDPFRNTRRYYRKEGWLHALHFRFISAAKAWKQPKDFIKQYEAQTKNYMRNARAINIIGEPGVGKSFSASNIAVTLAAQRWEQLQSDYFLQRSMLNRWTAFGDLEKLEAFRDLETAYAFYKKNEDKYIPCLLSKVPLYDREGRAAYKLTDEVMQQTSRAPEYSVFLMDEAGSTQGSDTSRDADKDMKLFYRYYRHFGNFMMIFTDPGDDGLGKYIRIVTDYNIRLRRQEWVMRPERGFAKLDKKKEKFFKKCEEGKYSKEREQYIAEELYFKSEYLSTIGFRKIPYCFEAADRGKTIAEEDKGVWYFPSKGTAIYDERAYRRLYKARGQKLDLSAWSSLLADEEDFPQVEYEGKVKRSKKAS